MAIFEGAGVAIVTPMKENGEVNFDKLGELIDFQIENGTDSIIICGTTGEASTLSHEEHIECIRYTVQHVNKRVPVVAGTGSNCTETAVYLSKQARNDGADGLLLVTPYYNKATQNGLIRHFTEIAKAADLPIILYNVPVLSLGGKGVISVLSNVVPRETHDIVAKYLAGDTQGSLELQLKYLPLIRALFSEVNPIPVKAALNKMGMNVGPLRSPLTEMEEAHAQLLYAEMKNVGLIA